MTHSGKNNYTPNASTKSIILLHNNDSPYYILQWGIYKKSSPQIVLRVRDIFYAKNALNYKNKLNIYKFLPKLVLRGTPSIFY